MPIVTPQSTLIPQISIRNLNFFYGKTQALKAINLDIYQRRVTAFIGPSGCGKSTLLRTINRMYDLYPGQRAEGELLIDNQNILGDDIDKNRQPMDVSKVKSGDYARVALNRFPFSGLAIGVTFGLEAVQFIEEGEPLGGGISVMDAFDDAYSDEGGDDFDDYDDAEDGMLG